MADTSNEFYDTDIVTNISYKTTGVSKFTLYDIKEEIVQPYAPVITTKYFKTTIEVTGRKNKDASVFNSYEIYPGTILKGKNGNPDYGIKENNLIGDTKYSTTNFEDASLNTDKLQYSRLRYGEADSRSTHKFFEALRWRYYLSTVAEHDRNISLLVEPYIILPLDIPAFKLRRTFDDRFEFEFNDFYYKDYYRPDSDLDNKLWILKDIDTIKKFSEKLYTVYTSNTSDKYEKNVILLNVAGASDTNETIGIYNDYGDEKIKSNDVAISYIIKLWNDWLKGVFDACNHQDIQFTFYTFGAYLEYMKENNHHKYDEAKDQHGNVNYIGVPVDGDAIVRKLLPMQSSNIEHLNGNMFIWYNDKSYEMYDKYYYASGYNYHIDLICHKDTNEGTYLYPINKDTGTTRIFQSFVGAVNQSPIIFEGVSDNVKVNVACKELILGMSYDLGAYAYNVYQRYHKNETFSDVETYTEVKKSVDKIFIPYTLYNDESSINDIDSTEVIQALDKKIEDDVLLTPNEYYSSSGLTGEYETGELGYQKITNKNETIGSDTPTWFWSNTLKNWCVFGFSGIHDNIQLHMWNGKNGWDNFIDVIKDPKTYLYDITKLRFGASLTASINYDGMSFYYNSVILTNDTAFSQYEQNSFQTKRIGKCWSDNVKGLKRFPFTIGIPTIMRLASGEIALLYNCTIPGPTSQHPLVYPENIKFINMMCRDYFTAGDDKTIADDWKRLQGYKKISDTPSAIHSMTESSLVDADEINTVKDKTDTLMMTFTPFKQYIETDNIESDSFVERWN